MNCKYCNTPLGKNAQFCSGCGTPVERNKSKKPLAIGIIAGVVVTVAVIAVSFILCKGTATTPEERIIAEYSRILPTDEGYVIYDIDKNDVPELLIFGMTEEGSYTYDVYTCEKKAKLIGKIEGETLSFGSVPGKNGILVLKQEYKENEIKGDAYIVSIQDNGLVYKSISKNGIFKDKYGNDSSVIEMMNDGADYSDIIDGSEYLFQHSASSGKNLYIDIAVKKYETASEAYRDMLQNMEVDSSFDYYYLYDFENDRKDEIIFVKTEVYDPTRYTSPNPYTRINGEVFRFRDNQIHYMGSVSSKETLYTNGKLGILLKDERDVDHYSLYEVIDTGLIPDYPTDYWVEPVDNIREIPRYSLSDLTPLEYMYK